MDLTVIVPGGRMVGWLYIGIRQLFYFITIYVGGTKQEASQNAHPTLKLLIDS
jgi:hypothetical protein